jgi:hypothetical protein
VLATLVVLLTGPWTASAFTIYYGPMWLMVAVIFLKQIWQRQKVDSDAPPTFMERFRERHPGLAVRIDPRWLLACVGVLFVILAVTLAGQGLFLLFAVAILVGLGALLAWLSGI